MHSKKRKSNKSSSLSKKRNNYSVDIVNKKIASETEFGGYPLDLLFGILYLKQKHPLELTLPFDIKELLLTYSNDLRNRDPFTFIGCLIYKCHDKIIFDDRFKNNNTNKSSKKNYKFKITDFEIEYPGKVSISNFKKMLLKAKRSGKRFTIIPLIFRWSCKYEFNGHANILIFDFKNNIVERFEPYGYIATFTELEENVSNGFNTKFASMIKSLKLGLEYKDNKQLIKKGPQLIEENQVERYKSVLEKKTDPEGFCGAWSLWYADLRLTNTNKNSKELIESAIKIIKDGKGFKLRQFIRNYSKFIVKERVNFLKKIKQKNPDNYRMREQLFSLENKKSEIADMLKTEKILQMNNKI
jgi:hypothetical protein